MARPGAVPATRPAQAGQGRFASLLFLGLLIEGVCVYWGVCATAHALPEPWVWSLAEGARHALETIIGPIATDDPPVTWERVKITQLLGGFALAYGAYAIAIALAMRSPLTRRELGLVLALGACFRLTLIPAPPMLETDMHRYVWDGAVGAAGINPYRYAPGEATALADPGRARLVAPEERPDLETLSLLAADPRLRPHFLRINHAPIPTIYPPLAQALFRTAARFAPGSEVAVKALVALLDAAVVGVLLLLLGALERPAGQVLIYAWCPLVLREFAGTGHYDPLAILCTVGALLALVRGRRAIAGALLGMGIASKLYPAIVAALLCVELGVVGLVTCALATAALYAPFLSAGFHLAEGLLAFATDWEFNAGLFALAERALVGMAPSLATGGYSVHVILSRQASPAAVAGAVEIPLDAFFLTKVLMGLVLVATLIAIRRHGVRSPVEIVAGAMAAIAALVLVSPVVDPWYFCWLMPQVAIFPAASWIYLSGGMVLHYLYFWDWHYPWWTRRVEYVPFFLMLAREQMGRRPGSARLERRGRG